MSEKHGPHHRDFDRRTRPLQCRVDPETRAEVDSFATENRISIAEALRQLVEWGLETRRLGNV